MHRGLITWDPFRELTRTWDEDNFWDDDHRTGLPASNFLPAANIYQDENNVIVEVAAAGMKDDGFEISVENDVLTICGKNEEEEKVEKKNYLRREYRSQSFVRKFALPMPVKADKAEADYKRGVLKVTLPKAEEVKPKKIAVKMNK